MKELHIHADRHGMDTKLTDENGVELKNVTRVVLIIEADKLIRAELTMSMVVVDAVVDGENVEQGPGAPPGGRFGYLTR